MKKIVILSLLILSACSSKPIEVKERATASWFNAFTKRATMATELAAYRPGTPDQGGIAGYMADYCAMSEMKLTMDPQTRAPLTKWENANVMNAFSYRSFQCPGIGGIKVFTEDDPSLKEVPTIKFKYDKVVSVINMEKQFNILQDPKLNLRARLDHDLYWRVERANGELQPIALAWKIFVDKGRGDFAEDGKHLLIGAKVLSNQKICVVAITNYTKDLAEIDSKVRAAAAEKRKNEYWQAEHFKDEFNKFIDGKLDEIAQGDCLKNSGANQDQPTWWPF